MINISRNQPPPASLARQEIQVYLEELADYFEGNIAEKPTPPISYRNSDLLTNFTDYFHAKCYLTEEKFEDAEAMDVDHFKPKNQFPNLVYDWNNLFPISHIANMLRTRQYPIGGLLDPCNPNDDVENRIIYATAEFCQQPYFHAIDSTDTQAVNTASQLNRVHNGHNDTTYKKTSSLRHAIQKKRHMIVELILKWVTCQDRISKVELELELRLLLSKRQSFTMLMRNLPEVRTHLPEEIRCPD